jgi:hypothetical protein
MGNELLNLSFQRGRGMVSGPVLAIRSRPENAEISVDGKFVGHAPAKLNLAAGSHTMVISAGGFAGRKAQTGDFEG